MSLLSIYTFICYIVMSSGEQEPLQNALNDKNIPNGNFYSAVKSTLAPLHNHSYVDKSENMLLIPVMTKFYDESKTKKNTYKKTPKSTIQKIIKKNRVKIKKFYIVTSRPSSPSKHEHDKQDDSKWKDDPPTTQTNQKRKSKRWNPKAARNPMPFQKLQSRRDLSKRTKRSEEINDTIILKDLDRIDYLNSEKDAGIDRAEAREKLN